MPPQRTRKGATASSGAGNRAPSAARSNRKAANDVQKSTSLSLEPSDAHLSNVWLLRARPFDGDVRSKEATELRAYLVPDRTYVVGTNPKAADVVVKEDITVSRTHATLRVVAGMTNGRTRTGDAADTGKTTVSTPTTTAHVLVRDTSSHGRTYLSRDMRDILKAQKLKELSEEGTGRAYHGYFMMLGQMSPFRLTRMAMGVCLSGAVPRAVEDAVEVLGFRKRGVGVGMVVVVGDALCALRDEVLLAMVEGVPVVTGGWVLAWLDAGRATTSVPCEEAYGVRVVGRGGVPVDVAGYDLEQVGTRLQGGELGCYRLGCVVGKEEGEGEGEGEGGEGRGGDREVSGMLVKAARRLGVVVDALEGRDGIEEWVRGCEYRQERKPLMVLRKQADVRLLPQPACAYCLLEDLRLALLDGKTGGLVRHVGDDNKERGEKKRKRRAREQLGEGEGWTVAAHADGQGESTDVEEDEEHEEHPIYTTEAPVLAKKKGFKSKSFAKKYRVPERRQIVRVIGEMRAQREDDQEWVEVEQERQMMMDAFDKQGLVIGPKKRAPKRK